MTYYINDDCIVCGNCEAECPVEAISPGATKYQIDPKLCDDYAACIEVCPVDAIHYNKYSETTSKSTDD